MQGDDLRDRVRSAVETDWPGFFTRIKVRWLGEPRMNRAHGCPFHEDSRASFSVFRGQTDGRIRWKCHAGCGHGDIFDAWMKARGLHGGDGFKQALDELADLYHVQRGP